MMSSLFPKALPHCGILSTREVGVTSKIQDTWPELEVTRISLATHPRLGSISRGPSRDAGPLKRGLTEGKVVTTGALWEQMAIFHRRERLSGYPSNFSMTGLLTFELDSPWS
jgi:hypothetical protein